MRALSITCFCSFAAAACSVAPPTPVARVATLPVYVDGALVGRVPVAVLASSIALTYVLPEAARDVSTWTSLDGEGAEGTTLHLRRPAEEYPGQEARLYVGRDGRAALGMFRGEDPRVPARVRALAARPTATLGGLTAVRLQTEGVARALGGEDDGAATAVAVASLALTMDGVTRSVGAHDLGPLPRTKVPRGPRTPAWDLRDVASLGGPTGHGRALRLEPTRGDAVTLDAATLARPDRLALLKINRKGQRKVRVYALEATPRLIVEVEDVRAIVVL